MTVLGGLDAGGGWNINVGGAVNFTGGSFTKGAGTFIFDGVANRNLTADGNDLGDISVTGLMSLLDTGDFDDVSVSGSYTTTQNFSVGGNFSDTGTLNITGGTLTFDNNGAQSYVSNGDALNNVTVGTGAVDSALTLNSDIEIGGNLSFGANGGSSINYAGDTILVSGDADFTNCGSLTDDATSLVEFNNGGAQSFTTKAALHYNDVTKSGSGTLGVTGELNVDDTLTVSAGTVVDLQANNFSIGTLVNNNVLQLEGSQGTQSITTMDINSGVVEYDGGAGGSVLIDSFYDLLIDGAGVFSLGQAIDINNDIDIDGGTLDVTAGNNWKINIGGDWGNGGGSFAEQTGEVEFDTAGCSNSFAETFYDVRVSGTLTLGAVLDVNHDLIISGTLDVNANQAVSVGHDWNNSGTFTARNGTVTFDGVGETGTLTTGGTGGGQDFWNLVVNDGGGAASSYTLADNSLVSNDLTVTDGTLDTATFNLQVSGTTAQVGAAGTLDFSNSLAGDALNIDAVLDVNGSLPGGGGNIQASENVDFTGGSYMKGAGTFIFDGVANRNLTADGNDLGDISVTGLMSLLDTGDFDDVSVSGSYTTTQNFSVGGNFSDTGTLNITGGTLTFDNNGAQSYVSNGDALNNVTVGTGAVDSALTLNSDIEIGGNLSFGANGGSSINYAGDTILITGDADFTNCGSLTDDATSLVEFNNGGAQSFTTKAALHYNDVTKSGSGTLGVTGELNVDDTLTVSAGTVVDLQANNFSIGTLVNNNVLQLEGSQGTQSITTMDINSGVVEYDGGAGGSVLIDSFYDLLIDGAGVFSLGQAIDINNDIDIDGGTLDVTAGNNWKINIGGDWGNGGGSFAEQTGEVEFDTAGCSNSFAEAFYDVRVSGTLTLGAALDVNHDLIITGTGTLDVNAANHGVSVGHDWNNSGTFTARNGTVTFDGVGEAGTLTTGGTGGGQDFWNLVVNDGGGAASSYTLADNSLVSNDLTVTDGTLDTATFNLQVSGTTAQVGAAGTLDFSNSLAGDVLNIDAVLDVNGSLPGGGGNIQASENVDFTGGSYMKGAGTFIFDGGAVQVLTAGGEDLGIAEITGAATDLQIGNQTVIFDDFTVTNGTLSLTGAAGTTTMQINTGNTIDNSGTVRVTDDASTVTLQGLGGLADYTGTDINYNTNSITLANIDYQTQLDFAAVGDTVVLGDANCLFDNIIIGAGTFDAGNNDFRIDGNWDNSGAGSYTNAATADFASVGNRTINSGGTGVGKPFNNITHSGAGQLQLTASAIQLNGNLVNSAGTIDLNDLQTTILGNMNISGGTLQTGSARVNVGGDWTTAGAAVFNAETSVVIFNGGGAQILITGGTDADHDFYNIAVSKGGNTLTLTTNDIICRNFLHYAGTLNIAGRTLRTTGDFAAFGAGYTADDDWSLGNTTLDVFKYNPGLSFARPASIDAAASAITSIIDETAVHTAAFANLDGATIRTDGNFYVNGSDMPSSGPDWYLQIRDNDIQTAFFAEAYNCVIDNSQVQPNPLDTPAVGNVAAVEGVTANGCSAEWRTTRTATEPLVYPDGIYTVYDDVIHIQFDELIENDNDEISAAVSAIFIDAYTTLPTPTPFTGTFTDPTCDTSTDDVGDIDTFYIQINSLSWNTDATGSTGGGANAGAGDNNSTDRRGTHQSNVPEIHFRKHFAGLYATLRDQYKNRLNTTNFTAAADYCRPALVNVVAGRAQHLPAGDVNEKTYDAHNYFHLKYSEPVTIGDLTMASANTQGQDTFSAPTQHGGEITDNSGSSTVTVNGYFSYPGRLPNDSRDGSFTSSLYRASPNGENPSANHGLTIYVAGYKAAPGDLWQGYIGDPDYDETDYTDAYLSQLDPVRDVSAGSWVYQVDPARTAITVPSNGDITDASGNAVEDTADTYDNIDIYITYDITSIGGNPAISMPGVDSPGWDVDPPIFSVFDDTVTPNTYEIVSIADPVSGKITQLEFFIRDNNVEQGGYSQAVDAGIVHPESGASLGIRDATFANDGGNLIFPYTAFTIADVNVDLLENTYNTAINTAVQDTAIFSSGAIIDDNDDSYFALTLNNLHNWNTRTALQIKYKPRDGYITDLAGNLIPLTAFSLAGVERIPPYIELALGNVGDDKLYIRFSEPVFGTGYVDVVNTDFTVSGVSNSISGIDAISYLNGGLLEAWFNLSSVLTGDSVLQGKIVPQLSRVVDKLGNEMEVTSVHRFSDIGLGVMEPVWASDNLHNTDLYGRDTTLRLFDGTGYLTDSNITLEASIMADSFPGLASNLYFDVDPPENVLNDGFWLPSYNNAIVPEANNAARGVNPSRVSGAVRDFIIPSDDSEIVTGSEVQFLLKVGDLFCASLLDDDDPRTLTPWSFSIRDIRKQSAGVTILNNVINPLNGEKTVLSYDLPSPGMVVINVFNMSGDLVNTLHRGAQGSGTYNFSWDGTNRAGNVVARGVYFIRVVAPGIDEYRKVMIVK